MGAGLAVLAAASVSAATEAQQQRALISSSSSGSSSGGSSSSSSSSSAQQQSGSGTSSRESNAAAPAVPVGYGSPLFVQQLSAMVASLEQQNVALQERARTAQEAQMQAMSAERDEAAHTKHLQETVDAQKLVRRMPPGFLVAHLSFCPRVASSTLTTPPLPHLARS